MNFRKAMYVMPVIGLLLFSGCKQTTEQQTKSVKYVKVEKVADYKNSEKLLFNGNVKEKRLVALSFRVGGPLVSLNVKTGDYVNEGDVIAMIDKRDYQLQLDNAKAQYEQLKGEYERYKELYDKKKIPANTYEKIESGYKMAKVGYENALNQLNDTKLSAPISGYIYEKMVENFNTVGPGQPIVSIIDRSQLEIVINVPENQVLKVKQCRNNFLSVKNAGVNDVPVKLESVNGKSGNDGLYEIRYLLNNPDELKIYPGMTAEIKIICQNNRNAIKISSNAIFRKDNKTCVWIYDSNKQQIKKREVVVDGLQSGGMVIIKEGLQGGDSIVTAGIHSLIDGQKVKPIGHVSATNVGGLL